MGAVAEVKKLKQLLFNMQIEFRASKMCIRNKLGALMRSEVIQENSIFREFRISAMISGIKDGFPFFGRCTFKCVSAGSVTSQGNKVHC